MSPPDFSVLAINQNKYLTFPGPNTIHLRPISHLCAARWQPLLSGERQSPLNTWRAWEPYYTSPVWLWASAWKSRARRFWLHCREELHPQSCQKQKELPGEVWSSLLLEVFEQMLENCLAMTSKVSPAPGISEDYHDDYCCCDDLLKGDEKNARGSASGLLGSWQPPSCCVPTLSVTSNMPSPLRWPLVSFAGRDSKGWLPNIHKRDLILLHSSYSIQQICGFSYGGSFKLFNSIHLFIQTFRAGFMGMWPVQVHRDLHSGGPHVWLDAFFLQIINPFGTRNPTFSFCNGPCKLSILSSILLLKMYSLSSKCQASRIQSHTQCVHTPVGGREMGKAER